MQHTNVPYKQRHVIIVTTVNYVLIFRTAKNRNYAGVIIIAHVRRRNTSNRHAAASQLHVAQVQCATEQLH